MGGITTMELRRVLGLVLSSLFLFAYIRNTKKNCFTDDILREYGTPVKVLQLIQRLFTLNSYPALNHSHSQGPT